MIARRFILAMVVLLCSTVGVLAYIGAPASAAVTHAYLSQIAEVPQINELPKGTPKQPVPGRITEPDALAVDSGHLYIAEHVTGTTATYRTDVFNASSLGFESQLSQPPSPIEDLAAGVAVGHSTPETQVYVGGTSGTEHEGVVAVFSQAGAYLGSWDGANTPSKGFGDRAVGGIDGIAVDNSQAPGDWAAGDVYVSDPGHGVVDVFKPEANGNETYVTQLTGVSAGEPFDSLAKIAVDGANGRVLVADGDSLDIFEPAVGMSGVYTFLFKISGTPVGPFLGLGQLAVDGGNGDIYVGSGGTIDQFNSAGVYLGRNTGLGTPSGNFASIYSLAVDPASHSVYVGDYRAEGSSSVDVFGPDLVIPDVTTAAVSGLTPTSVMLDGTVDPDSEGVASCQFMWGTTTAFGQTAACSPSSVSEGSSPVTVRGALSGLEPDTTYYYRLQASNKNGVNPGEEWQTRSFTTPGPGLDGESVSSVSSTSVTLNAALDPHKAATTYYFQYGTTSNYGVEAPILTEVARYGPQVGVGEGAVRVSQHVQGLLAGTLYHYRVVAVSELESSPGKIELETFDGRDQTFRTQPNGGSLALPDGRSWELVSPVDKDGALILGLNAVGLTQASTDGGGLTYPTNSPTESYPQGSAVKSQVLSTRGAEGWSSLDIATPKTSATGPPFHPIDYQLFSENLSLGLVDPSGVDLTLLSAREASERTPYIRRNSLCPAEGTGTEVIESDCYLPLLTGKEPYADVPPGTKFGGNPAINSESEGDVAFEGASPDLNHVILATELGSSVSLTSTPTSGVGLYEWSAEKPPKEELNMVSLLPDGAVAKFPVLGYGSPPNAMIRRHAISNDGSRVFWSEREIAESHLYMRDVAKAETVQLDTVQSGEGASDQAAASFETASSDGSKVFFTDTQPLTEQSGHVGEDLYECGIVEEAGSDKCRLSDLTPRTAGHNAEVQGAVLGASEDGSYVYFIAAGVLSSAENNEGEKPVEGADNLYVSHYNRESGREKWESPRLIAVLSKEDQSDWDGEDGYDHSRSLSGLTARVSPNGRYLAFMSNRSLTGYDNHDVNSDEPDEEVYLYDASSDRVVCASCDPTGARPVGVEPSAEAETWIADSFPGRYGTWTAANVPGWTQDAQSSLYQSRYLSDSGRLFFNSSDALVPQDIDGGQDVYEYEPAGVGDCSTASSTFGEASGGCVGLISSGTSARESAFLDASETGGDVFFLTAERLLPQDVDTALDVYDAHECSSQAPCMTASVSPPECTTADACRAAPLAQPTAFGSPSSATFSGAGNVATAPTSKPIVKAKTLTRAQKLALAMSVCHKKKARKRRVQCEREARKRYGAIRSRKATANRVRG